MTIKGRLIQRGEHLLEYDGEDADAIREALRDGCAKGAVPDGLYDVTDTDRSNVDPDEWLELSEDGKLLFAGWLGGVEDEPPGADRAALEQARAVVLEMAAAIRADMNGNGRIARSEVTDWCERAEVEFDIHADEDDD